MIWQAFGAAISLPLYFARHLDWLNQTSVQPQAVSEASSQAVPFSFALGAIVPAVIGLLPAWIDPSTRSTERHQNILAAWQPDPLWVSMIQQLVVALLCRHAKSDERKSYRWARFSFLLAAASSAIGHLYVKTVILTSTDWIHRFTRMYVPFLSKGPSETTDILVHGPWLFLQYDLIIISLSSLSWGYSLVRRLRPNGAPTRLTLVAYLLLGTLTIGPGATVSLLLFWRERQLQRLRDIKEASSREKYIDAYAR